MDNYLIGWGHSFPDYEYTNEDLCKIFNLVDEKASKYEKITGIKRRKMCVDHWHGGKQIIRDDQMVIEASQKALEVAQISSKEIDVIISTAATFDYIMPGIAERVQSGLKVIQSHIYNLIGGCSEFLNGLILAKTLLEQGQAATILVTSSSVQNAFYKNFRYPMQWFIEGDAGGAFILSSKKKGMFRLNDSYYSNISRMENMFSVPLWGVKEPCPLIIEKEEIDSKLKDWVDCEIKYRWYRQRFSTDEISHQMMGIGASERAVREILRDKEKTYFILPQPTLDVVNMIASRLELKEEQIAKGLIEHGNCGNVSSAVNFCEFFDVLTKYDDVILVAAGAGASFGAVQLVKI
jgi:3-oxoacyl-[acyl-carrier-protein] synthase-3